MTGSEIQISAALQRLQAEKRYFSIAVYRIDGEYAIRIASAGASCGHARRFICPLAISVGWHAPASSMRSTTYPKTIRTEVVSQRFDLKPSCLSSPRERQSASSMPNPTLTRSIGASYWISQSKSSRCSNVPSTAWQCLYKCRVTLQHGPFAAR
jgi:hypothetical protein